MASLERDKQQSNAQSEREKLIKELGVHFINSSSEVSWLECMADFILKDRERICEPSNNLVLDNGGSSYEMLCQAIEEMRKRAGIESK